MSYLKSIKRLQAADNLGGILSIWVARKADIESIPEPIDGVVYGSIVFKTGKSFTLWEATPESRKIKSNARVSQEGTSKNIGLDFSIPKDSAEIRAQFERALEDEFIVLYKYPTGKTKLYGTLEAPVKFEYNHDSGSNYADGNRFSCSFYYEGPDNTFFYDGSIPPPGPVPAVVRWSNGTVIATLYPGDILIVDSDFEHDFELIQA